MIKEELYIDVIEKRITQDINTAQAPLKRDEFIEDKIITLHKVLEDLEYRKEYFKKIAKRKVKVKATTSYKRDKRYEKQVRKRKKRNRLVSEFKQIPLKFRDCYKSQTITQKWRVTPTPEDFADFIARTTDGDIARLLRFHQTIDNKNSWTIVDKEVRNTKRRLQGNKYIQDGLDEYAQDLLEELEAITYILD